MDKTKLAGIGFLVVLGGALLFARQQEAARENPTSETSAAHDHDGDGVSDHGDEAHSETAATAETAVAHDHDGDGVADHGDEAHAAPANAETATTETTTTETAAAPTADVTELKIEDIRKGTGATAEAGDRLTMNYRGTLLNGKEFDSSYGRGPFEFQLGASQVIQGWDQGIQGMKVGGKRKLVIPSELAYGAQSPSPDIPANSTLVFEVELLDVAKAG